MIPRRRFSRAFCLSATGALLMFLTLPATGSAAPPPPKPSMAGETFTGVPTVTFTCDPMNNSTISYTVTGTASGPYPGTFTGTGAATLGPQGIFSGSPDPNAPGAVLSFTASFTIMTTTGAKVSGSLQLAPPGTLAGNQGFCDQNGIQSFTAQADYTATIKSKGPGCTDTGQAGTAVNAGITYPVAQFNQFFDTNHPLC